MLIRADASAARGTGHVMRCLALAHAWRENGGNAHFLLAEVTPSLRNKLLAENFIVETVDAVAGSSADAQQTALRAREFDAKWVILDGNHFDTNYQTIIKGNAVRLLCVDDFGTLDYYCCDVVLNPNFGSNPDLYHRRSPSTRLLLGSEYVLLRREFSKWQGWRRPIPSVAKKIIVTFGGADPEGLTGPVVSLLSETGNFQITAVVGGSNPKMMRLAELGNKDAAKIVIDTADLPDLLADADMAILMAGTTIWEALFLGLPSLTYFRDSLQGRIVSLLQQRGALASLGTDRDFDASQLVSEAQSLANDTSRRALMSKRGRQIVDGKGAQKVACLLEDGHDQ